MSLSAWTPPLIEAGITALILLASYLIARVTSWFVTRTLERSVLHTHTTLDDRLLQALKRPLTQSLFLLGAYAAIHRLQVEDRWLSRLDAGLFALGVLILAFAAARAFGILMLWYATESQAAKDGELASELGPFLSRLGKVFIALLASITVLEHCQVDVQSLVVSLGVSSLAVGLAAQDTLANMFAGFTLMLDRPFRAGDRVQLSGGEVGDVQTVGMRATRIKTTDDTVLIVPNSALVKDKVVNLSRPNRNLLVKIPVSVAYGTDLAATRLALCESSRACSLVEPSREPAVLVSGFGELAIQLTLVCYAKDYTEASQAASAIREDLLRRFREQGIEIPVPVRKVLQEGR